MKRLAGSALVAGGIAYPFAVYYGAGAIRPRTFALVLGVMWLARCVVAEPASRSIPALALAFCAVLAFVDSGELLKWYPVLINAALFVVFASSLVAGRPLIERLASAKEGDLPPRVIRYTRRVTQVWAGFFAFNGLLAAGLTVWAPLSWWTAYNGFIAYVLIAALFAGEWLLRPKVRSAH